MTDPARDAAVLSDSDITSMETVIRYDKQRGYYQADIRPEKLLLLISQYRTLQRQLAESERERHELADALADVLIWSKDIDKVLVIAQAALLGYTPPADPEAALEAEKRADLKLAALEERSTT